MKKKKFKETEIGLIPEDWGVKELNEVASYITEKVKANEVNIKNYVSTENLLPNKCGITIASKIPASGKVTKFNKSDILFSNIRTYFKKLWLANFDGGCSNDVLVIRSNPALIKQQFLFYFLSQDSFFDFTVKTSKGTKMPRGDKNAIMSYNINFPNIEEQEAIAKILSDLDSKIELLQKQNEILENIGKAIFKHWFVDFEFPNKKGKPYKSSNGKMVESDLREIPEGWKIKKIIDLNLFISDYVANGSFASLKENVSKIFETRNFALFIRNTDLKNKFESKRYIDKKAYNFLRKTKLLGNELIISNVADVGSVYICPNFKFPMSLGNNIIMIKSLENYEENFYLYFYFKYFQGKEQIISITSGSAQLKFNKTDFKNLSIIMPDKDLFNKYNDIVARTIKKIQTNEQIILSLQTIRDLLLPKLMSGKIRVPVGVKT